MQSLSSSRPCTAHFYRWKSLACPAPLPTGKNTEIFYSVLFKNCNFSTSFLPFPCAARAACSVTVRATSWAVPAPVCVHSCSACHNWAPQELPPLPPKGLPGSVLLTPVRAVRTLKHTISVVCFLSLVALLFLLTNITR